MGMLKVAFLVFMQQCGNCWLETRATQFWIAEVKAQRHLLDVGQMPDGKLEMVEGKKLGTLWRKWQVKLEKLFLQLVTISFEESLEYGEQC